MTAPVSKIRLPPVTATGPVAVKLPSIELLPPDACVNPPAPLTEDAASTVLRAFEDDPDLDLVYGEVEWIDGDGRLTGRHAGNISNLTELLDIYRIWWGGRQWVQPEVFYRRSLWERVGNFSSDYDLAFDFDYWVRCFLAGLKVRRIARPLARFRLHEAQKSKRAAEAAAEVRTIVAEALAEKPPIGAWERFRLQAWLGFDRYQAGQDHGDRVRPPLGRTLLRHPDWLIIPEVRQRFCRWALSCLRPAPVMGGGGK